MTSVYSEEKYGERRSSNPNALLLEALDEMQELKKMHLEQAEKFKNENLPEARKVFIDKADAIDFCITQSEKILIDFTT